MNMTEMITLVRRELRDEDAENYRWSDDELTRHINRAVGELSESLPLPAKATISTTPGSREIDISELGGRVMVAAVEYPAGLFPPVYSQFSVWGDVLTILSDSEPDGSNCNLFYGTMHTLDASSSTIPVRYEDLVAGGAGGYAAIEWAGYAINRVNVGGDAAAGEFFQWGKCKLEDFRRELGRLGRKNRVRLSSLYNPCSRSTTGAVD